MANLIPRDTFFHDMVDSRRNFDQAFNRLLRWPSAQEERTDASEFLEITAPIATASLPKKVEI
jgi:hypothetical protein